ncbi:MAG: leucyl/phenylalanyl-tRNA--protein transferase [Bacillota bacterium]|nr:leucyl/phenylalanyl-tRNA--protein transferase [Bacillota bacterium]
MPVYRLSDKLVFPHPSLSNEDGLLAVGGDLSCRRLCLAYENGIFPWYSGDDILWWSPDPRFLLFPKDLKISKSMQKFLRKNMYKVTFDTCFRDVMANCGNLRKENTWINEDMLGSYCELHKLGIAHSVETWYENRLVGGLYGLSMGSCFFGESMFSTMDNASKVALIELVKRIEFSLIDCQVYSEHLESLGATNVSRDTFLELLDQGLNNRAPIGSWRNLNS